VSLVKALELPRDTVKKIMKSKGSILSPGRVLLSGFFIMAVSFSVWATDESIPPYSWVYDALLRFELKGLIVIEPDRPMARSTVRSYVIELSDRARRGNVELTPREEFLLERLKEEFLCSGSDLSAREDRPAIVFSKDENVLALDASVGGALVKRADRSKGEVDGYFIPQVLLGLGYDITMESNYHVEITPEYGEYRRNRKPSPRRRSFRGVTSEFERGYLAVSNDNWRFSIGRDYLNVGSDPSEGLLVSRTAGSLDRFAFDFSISRFHIKTIHAILDPVLERRLALHRLTIRMPGDVYLGFGEAVLYTGRGLDYTYLVPFSSYYANQFNERGDDNILWSFDWKVSLRRFMFYGELLIDDLQYERDEPAPDRLGFSVAMRGLLPVGSEDLSLGISYTYIDIFTYAHKDSLMTSYVTGDGNFPENPLIGSPLGPDADRVRIDASYSPTAPLELRVGYEVLRRGEGNDLREWDRVEDPHPPFPSGDVLTEKRVLMGAGYDLRRGSYVDVAVGVRYLSGGPDGVDDRNYFGSIELRLDL